MLDATPPTATFSMTGSAVTAPYHEVVVDVTDEPGGSGIDPDADFKHIWSAEESIPLDSPLWDSASTFKDELKITSKPGLVGDYYLHVKFWDGANEVISRSEGTFSLDSKAPEVVFTPDGHDDVRADYLAVIEVFDDNKIASKKYQWVKVGDTVNPENFIVWADEETTLTVQASECGVVEAGSYVLVVEITDEFGNGIGEYVESQVFKIDPNVETITVSSTPENDGTYNKAYEIIIDTIGYEDTIYYQWTDSSLEPAKDDENWILATEEMISYGQDLNGERYLHIKATSDGIDYATYRVFLLDNTSPTIDVIDPIEMPTPAKSCTTSIIVSDNILGRDITLYGKWVMTSILGEDSQLWNNLMTWDDAIELTDNTAKINGVSGEYILFVKAVDEAGNEGISHSGIFKIDNESPIGTIEITTDISNDRYATVSLSNLEDNLSENGSLEYIYSADGGLNFSKTWIPVSAGLEILLPGNEPTQVLDVHMKFRDEAGNISEEIDTIKIITYSPEDVVTYVEYSATEPTSSDVTAYLRTNGIGSIEILNNNGSDEYVFTENGTFYFETVDSHGTVKQTKAIVYYIDKEVQDPMIEFSTRELTNQDVQVTFTPREVVTITPPVDPNATNTGLYTYNILSNGTYTFTLEDSFGNAKDIDIVIDNIDKTPPILNISLSNTEATSQPVEVTLSSNEDIVVLNNLGSMKRTFRQNGTYEFIVEDLAGNKANIIATVDNIDTTPPEVFVYYSTLDWTSDNVIATIMAKDPIKDPITILNNGGSPHYEFKSNGIFYFKVSDVLGNTLNIPVRVSNIDKNKPVIEFEGNDRLIFVQNTSYDLDDVIVFDDVSKDLESGVNINKGSFNISVVGDYEITYSVSDDAGNITSITREVKVISPHEFIVFVNGKDVNMNGKVMLYEANIDLGIFNSKGDMSIKWKEGRVARGLMKSGCNYEPSNGFTVTDTGWYTVYIQDQERNTKYFYVYITSME